ncbi:BAP31 domain-containing protein [Alternaria alternata]|nr:BAP31 domain-containing protein [Alternaria alternata]
MKMKFCYYGALRDEGEELAAPCEGKRDDEGAEDEHLRHQEHEDLIELALEQWL